VRLLTPGGDLVTVEKRGWPLALLDQPRNLATGNSLITLVGSGDLGSRYATYTRIYKENPWVNAAVTTVAWGLARMILKVYQLKADGQRERVRGDLPAGPGRPSAGVALDNLLRNPSPRYGRQRLWRATATDYLIFDNAMWAFDRDPGSGAIMGLYRVPWSKVTVIEGDVEPILGYKVRGNKTDRFFAPEDVIHFTSESDPDSPVGVSKLESLKYTVALHEALERHLVAFFENQARPSGNLKLQPGAKQDIIDTVRDQVRQLYASPENAGKVMVTTGDWQSITQNADQSQIIELAKLSREEIAAVFHVPPPIIGILDRAIMSNVRELREQYVRDVVGPHASTFEDALMSQLVMPNPAWSNLFVEFDLSEPLRPDLEAQAKAMETLERTFTTNERRRLVNLPDLDFAEADTVVVPSGNGFMGITPPAPPAPTKPIPDPAKGDVAPSAEDAS
jgi:HK97 family phage portal protein